MEDLLYGQRGLLDLFGVPINFLSGVIYIASFPVLCIDYLEKIFPVFNLGWPRYVAILVFTLVLSFLNYTGLVIVGFAAIIRGIVSLSPSILMSLIAIPKIKPHRWISLGQKGVEKDWNLFLNTLFWNLNGEVDKPRKTFPKALFIAVIFTCLAYLFPLIAVIGAADVDQSSWESGFHAEAAEVIAGKWLKYWTEVGAVLSAIGLFEAQLSSCVYQVLGMADLGFSPKFFAKRSIMFNTPWVGILVATTITLAMSYMKFTDIISSVNFLYSLGMLLEYASLIWLRRKFPEMKRPYKVPLSLVGLVIMCLIPSVFLIFVMTAATKIVFLISGLITLAAIVWYYLMNFCKSKKCFKFSSGEMDFLD